MLGLVLALAGCRMDVNVGIDVAEDGSGTVSVAVGVDDDLFARVPGAADRVHLDDLSAAGWEVTGPAKESGRQHVGASVEVRSRTRRR